MPRPVDAVWTWPDAVVAAVLAVCLATAFTLLAARLAGPHRRATAAGPAVAAALVVAMAGALLTRGDAVARTVVAVSAVVGAVVVVAVVARLRARRTAPEREPHPLHNEIAPPDRRC